MSELIYIFLGKGKDPDGRCRKMLTDAWRSFGGEITDDPSKANVIAALGGDGTIMRAAHLAVKHDTPVIGINLGRIGYMAELDESEILLLEKIFYKGIRGGSENDAPRQRRKKGDICLERCGIPLQK